MVLYINERVVTMAIIGSFCGGLLALGVMCVLDWLVGEFDQLKQMRGDYRRRR